MTATTTERNTPQRSAHTRSFPVKAATRIKAGTLVALDSSGWAVEATTSTTIKVVGVADRTVENSAGANGDLRIEVRRDGAYRFENSASSDAIATTDIGATCFAVDNQTVAKTNGSSTRSAAGKVLDVDTLGVWVTFD